MVKKPFNCNNLRHCQPFFTTLLVLIGGNVPNILHQVTVPIIDNEKCQSMFTNSGHKKVVRESFLCAGYEKGEKDSCEVIKKKLKLFRLPFKYEEVLKSGHFENCFRVTAVAR